MVRLYTSGAELSTGVESLAIRVSSAGGTAATRDTVVFRSGAASWKCNSGAGNASSYVTTAATLAIASTSYFARAYMNFTSLPGSTVRVMIAGNASGGDIEVRLTAAGVLQLFRGATQIGSDSSAISPSTWYRFELSWTFGALATNFTAAELKLDGTSLASASGFTQARNGGVFVAGWNQAPGANLVVNVDDFAVNDSTGAANTTFPGSGKVVLLSPISDNAIGNWLTGAGGGTSLFDAVNNDPPVGVADASATATSQIRLKSTTFPNNYDANMTTYSTAGVAAADTVNAVIAFDVDGEDPSTGTKAGGVSVVSNPAITEVTFNFGDDGGAQGTYVNLWTWHRTAYSDAPSVTVGTSPVMRVRCTAGSSGTRAASVCFMGMYVDYTPAAAGFQPRHPAINHQNPAVL